MKKTSIILMVCLFLVSSEVFCAGPGKIAKSNRDLWPYPLNTPPAFDVASQMEMLVFIKVLMQKETLDTIPEIKASLGLKIAYPDTVKKWKKQVKDILINNFNHAIFFSKHDFLKLEKPVTWSELLKTVQTLEIKIPADLNPWYQNAKAFYEYYIYEQMRLAALFPKVSSEILKISESEIQGYSFEDKNYLLTFDDGPTPVDGNTDKILQVLKLRKINACFFVLGEKLNLRLKTSSKSEIKQLYKSMLVGSHAQIHKSHPRYKDWKTSLTLTQNLIDSIFPDSKNAKFFRPPYGQRNRAMISHLDRKNCRIMLWNIDSQDWSQNISAQQVAHRVVTLMLLWRRGILLFHDVHPKVQQALPIIWDRIKGSEINWVDASKL